MVKPYFKHCISRQVRLEAAQGTKSDAFTSYPLIFRHLNKA